MDQIQDSQNVAPSTDINRKGAYIYLFKILYMYRRVFISRHPTAILFFFLIQPYPIASLQTDTKVPPKKQTPHWNSRSALKNCPKKCHAVLILDTVLDTTVKKGSNHVQMDVHRNTT